MSQYQWNDPRNTSNYLTVEPNGRVNYYYNGSFEKGNNTPDVGAVLRACKAWKAWVKQNPGEYWCAPARPELEAFYRKCFPGVKIKKQNYSWWKLLAFPLVGFAIFTTGLVVVNNIYLSSVDSVELRE